MEQALPRFTIMHLTLWFCQAPAPYQQDDKTETEQADLEKDGVEYKCKGQRLCPQTAVAWNRATTATGRAGRGTLHSQPCIHISPCICCFMSFKIHSLSTTSEGPSPPR